MSEGYGELLKVFELKPKYFFAIWFAGAIVIFAPQSVLEKFGLLSTIEQFRGWIGIVTIVFFVLWAVQLFSVISEKREKKKEAEQAEKNFDEYKQAVFNRASSLSLGEAFLLAFALRKNQQVIYAAFTDRQAQSLVRKGFLTVSGAASATDFPFEIPDYVWEYLQNNKKRFIPQDENELKQFDDFMNDYDSLRPWQRDSFFNRMKGGFE